jgi:hypothetical protein
MARGNQREVVSAPVFFSPSLPYTINTHAQLLFLFFFFAVFLALLD